MPSTGRVAISGTWAPRSQWALCTRSPMPYLRSELAKIASGPKQRRRRTHRLEEKWWEEKWQPLEQEHQEQGLYEASFQEQCYQEEQGSEAGPQGKCEQQEIVSRNREEQEPVCKQPAHAWGIFKQKEETMSTTSISSPNQANWGVPSCRSGSPNQKPTSAKSWPMPHQGPGKISMRSQHLALCCVWCRQKRRPCMRSPQSRRLSMKRSVLQH